MRDENECAWYINLKGGDGPDRGLVLGEDKLDLSRTVWPPSEENKWLRASDRMAALQTVPMMKQVEEMAKRCRLWLRNCMVAILEEHKKEKREGPPRIVFVLHGGIRHFLTKTWYCDFSQDPSGNWSWKGSSALKNLELNVYRFKSLTDDEADLEELDLNPEYETTFGKYYRHMSSDASLVYKQPDGAVVDQRLEHWNFIVRTASSVQATVKNQWAIVEPLLNWKGARQFIREMRTKV
jgi:hypothetical protein